MSRETVIMKRETKKKIGAPMMVMGVIIFFATLLMALLLDGPFILWMASFSSLAQSLVPPGFALLDIPHMISKIFTTTGLLVIAVLLWLIMLALAYALVGMLAGKDPEGPQAIKMVMAGIDERKAENRNKARMRR